MQKLLKALIVGVTLLVGSTVLGPSPVEAQYDYSPADNAAIIYEAAGAYGQLGDMMLAVARCESTLNEYAYSVRGEMGLFQFHPGTWAQTPWAGTDPYNPYNNAYAAAWMWSQGRQREWVCYNMLYG